MEEGENVREELSLVETPTWAVATVVAIMVTFGFLFHASLKHFTKWLHRTKRKSLYAALEKIKEELMLFGVLSLLMGHWIVFVAKICIESSLLSSKFYPCEPKNGIRALEHFIVSSANYDNRTKLLEQSNSRRHNYCPEGKESFASHESLEQLHRFLFVLGITHVAYSFVAIALAMIKIYSWRTWERQAKLIAIQGSLDTSSSSSTNLRMRRLTTFISHRTSHPWSKHRALVWMLCLGRQFWSSISHADYMALRMGFITAHELPLSYDFLNYMLRSMEEEFCDIVGISVPLWIYAIFCMLIDFHGTNAYFWLSFLPAILILLIGTKLHRVVVKLAVEITESCPLIGHHHQFKLRDDLFWFGRPRLLLWLIQFISFQNAFEMATFLWSLWEIKESSCFMENRIFLAVRLLFGITTQCWCSFVTFPLYVIITQMGSRYKKAVISEKIRLSLHGWQRRVKARRSPSFALLSVASTTSFDSMADDIEEINLIPSSNMRGRSMCQESTSMNQVPSSYGVSPSIVPLFSRPIYDNYDHDDDPEYIDTSKVSSFRLSEP